MQPNDGQPRPEPKPAPTPAMDVVAPHPEPVAPPAETAAASSAGVHEAPGEKRAVPPPAKPIKTKPPKQPGNGVGLAIVATVVIVLALAAMTTYAYIKTAK